MRWKIKANQRSWRFTCQRNRKFGYVQLTGSKEELIFSCTFLRNHSYTVTMRTLKSLTLITRILYNFYTNSLKPKVRDNRWGVEENRRIKFTFSRSIFTTISDFWSAYLSCETIMIEEEKIEKERYIRHLEVREPRSLRYSGLASATLILLRTFILD